MEFFYTFTKNLFYFNFELNIQYFMPKNLKILIVNIIIFVFYFCNPAYSQLSRMAFEVGSMNNKWEDATNFQKLETQKSSGLVLFVNASVVEVFENRLYFGTGLRLAKRGATVTGPFYDELEPVYSHQISYTSFDIPIYYEFRYPILKYRYRYSAVLDKLAIAARVGADFSFLASSHSFVYKNNDALVYSGKAIRNYSPRINDLLHHIYMYIGAEFYFTDNYGVSFGFAHDRSRALTKTFNHPVFNKSVEYQPANARFFEQANMFTIGGIYRFLN